MNPPLAAPSARTVVARAGGHHTARSRRNLRCWQPALPTSPPLIYCPLTKIPRFFNHSEAEPALLRCRIIPAMCNHLSLHTKNTGTWPGTDIPLEDVRTGANIFDIASKAMSWSSCKRMHAFRCLCSVANWSARSQNSRTRKAAARAQGQSERLCTSTRSLRMCTKANVIILHSQQDRIVYCGNDALRAVARLRPIAIAAGEQPHIRLRLTYKMKMRCVASCTISSSHPLRRLPTPPRLSHGFLSEPAPVRRWRHTCYVQSPGPRLASHPRGDEHLDGQRHPDRKLGHGRANVSCFGQGRELEWPEEYVHSPLHLRRRRPTPLTALTDAQGTPLLELTHEHMHLVHRTFNAHAPGGQGAPLFTARRKSTWIKDKLDVYVSGRN
jgi:hypothetical protein